MMISYYGNEIWRHKQQMILSENARFFKFLSTREVNLVDKVKRSTYLCVILHVKHKKLPILAVFAWFLILGEIQDGDHVRWRHRPSAVSQSIKFSSFFRENQRLSTEGKIF